MLEAYTITGAGDMWARVVARSNADLQRVIDLVLTDAGIDRSTTVIALATQIPLPGALAARCGLGASPEPGGDAPPAAATTCGADRRPRRWRRRASRSPTLASQPVDAPHRRGQAAGAGLQLAAS